MILDFEGFKKFLEEMGDDNKNRTVKKSVPAKKEWKAKHKEMHALFDEYKEKKARAEATKKNFWSEIELTLNEFGDMRYNTETDEIDILEDADTTVKRRGVKSPFI